MKIHSKFIVDILTFGFAKAITIFPFIFIKYKKDMEDAELIEHERRHLKQQIGLLLVFFYVLYILFYIANRIKRMNHETAYYNIPFEKDAYTCVEMPSKWYKGWYFWVKYT